MKRRKRHAQRSSPLTYREGVGQSAFKDMRAKIRNSFMIRVQHIAQKQKK